MDESARRSQKVSPTDGLTWVGARETCVSKTKNLLGGLWCPSGYTGGKEGLRKEEGERGVAGECVGQSEEWNWQEAHTLLLQTGLLPPPIPLSSPQNNVQTGF